MRNGRNKSLEGLHKYEESGFGVVKKNISEVESENRLLESCTSCFSAYNSRIAGSTQQDPVIGHPFNCYPTVVNPEGTPGWWVDIEEQTNFCSPAHAPQTRCSRLSSRCLIGLDVEFSS